MTEPTKAGSLDLVTDWIVAPWQQLLPLTMVFSSMRLGDFFRFHERPHRGTHFADKSPANVFGVGLRRSSLVDGRVDLVRFGNPTRRVFTKSTSPDASGYQKPTSAKKSQLQNFCVGYSTALRDRYGSCLSSASPSSANRRSRKSLSKTECRTACAAGRWT